MSSAAPTPATDNGSQSTSTRTRVLALDALRGLAVLGMILVVSPGSWEHSLPILKHAAWHGYTLSDLVFPAFLFAVGAAMALRFPLNRPLGEEAIHAARRTTLLIALGLVLNLLPNFDFAHMRIPGVLQRIGLCYGLAAMIMLCFAKVNQGARHFPVTPVAVAALALLIGWILVLRFTSAPGFPMGSVTEAGTLAAWVDRELFTVAHLWPYGTDVEGRVVYDPEGLLSTLPATTNVLIGALTAHWLGRSPSTRHLQYALVAGAVLIGLGHLLEPIVVINKRIWTSSFALVSCGWAIVAYSVLFFALPLRSVQTLMTPTFILGGNAILAFVLSQTFGAMAGFPMGGTTPQNFGFEIATTIVANPFAASFLCAAGVLSTVTLLIWPLHRRGLHWRL